MFSGEEICSIEKKKCWSEKKRARHRRKTIRIRDKCSTVKFGREEALSAQQRRKHSSAEQQFAYHRSIVLVASVIQCVWIALLMEVCRFSQCINFVIQLSLCVILLHSTVIQLWVYCVVECVWIYVDRLLYDVHFTRSWKNGYSWT